MPQVEISDEIQIRLKVLTKLVDAVLDAHSDDLNEYVELTVALDIEKMHRDVLPHDNQLLQETIVKMFKQNPEFVTEFVTNTLKAGQEAQLSEVKQKWQPCYA